MVQASYLWNGDQPLTNDGIVSEMIVGFSR